MTETGFYDILSELDTVTDVVEYLAAKEERPGRGATIIEGGERELLAYYLVNNRSFPENDVVLFLDGTSWNGLQQRPEFRRRKEADKISYAWDRLIEHLSDGPPATNLDEHEVSLSDLELALRVLNKERRFSRRMLGQKLVDFIEHSTKGIRSRILTSPNGVIYVLAFFQPKEDFAARGQELAVRCFVARHIVGAGDTIVGIGIAAHTDHGSKSDLVYLHTPQWSDADSEIAKKVQDESGYFQGQQIQHYNDVEYPAETPKFNKADLTPETPPSPCDASADRGC